MTKEDVETTVGRVRARVTAKTLIQDVSDPLSGQLDRRRIAARFNNLETAVGDLSEAVDELNTKVDGAGRE